MSPSVRTLATLKGNAVATSTNETWRNWLKANGGSGNSIPELERSFLRSKAAAGQTLNEMWNSYLNAKGYTGGNIADRQRRFFSTFSGTV